MNSPPLPHGRPRANAQRVRRLIRALALARDALRLELGSDVEAVVDPLTGTPILLRSGQDSLLQSVAYHQQLSTILTNVRDSVVVLDRAGLVRFWNPGSEALFGYGAEEMLGQPLAALHPDTTTAALADELRDIWDGRERRSIHECRRKDGTTVWADVRSAPLRDGDGVVTGILRVANDVTAHKRLEAELRRASQEADDANRAKSEFLANMSHEIRTPMNAIIGMTDIVLDDTELTTDQRRSLEVVRQSADGLLDIINDILDFSKIEAGKLTLEPVAFDLHEALDRPLKALAVRAEQKGLELVGDIAADVPGTVIGDAGRLAQVLINLVGNAIKFTERGEVVVAVGVERHDAETTLLHVRVRDTGIGIAADKHAGIFKAFEQADGSSTRRYGGTGLGLTISASLVGLMGGRIWVDSAPGNGATFHFTARFGRLPDATAAAPAPLAGVRALLIEDNATTRTALSGWLTTWGATCTAVATAAAARAALQRSDDAGFDVALIDASLPDEDGWSVLAWLAGRRGCARVLLGSHLDRDGLQRAALLGAGHLGKPLSQPALRAGLLEVLADAPLGGRADAPIPALAPTRPLRVLVAEDQDINQEVISHLLVKHGHSVAVVGNGVEALERWRRERFDLVLMDVQMPVMDGLQATSAIRAAERARGEHVPIVALTAHARSDDALRCLAAGMDAHVAKPLHAHELLGLLQRVAAGEMPAPRVDQPTAAATGPIDVSRCLEIVGGQPEIRAQLAATFLQNIAARLQALHAAIVRGDADELFQAAHSLRTALVTFAADDAVAATRRIELCALDGDLDAAAAALSEAHAEVARVVAALGTLPHVPHAA